MYKLWLFIALTTGSFGMQASASSTLSLYASHNASSHYPITGKGDLKDLCGWAGAVKTTTKKGAIHFAVGGGEKCSFTLNSIEGLFKLHGARSFHTVVIEPQKVAIETLRLPTYLPWKSTESPLVKLILTGCGIKELPAHFAGICGAQLEELNLSCNQISKIHVNAFIGCSALIKLNLSDNQLTTQVVKPELFKYCVNLIHVELKGNQEKEFPDLKEWTTDKDLTLTAQVETV